MEAALVLADRILNERPGSLPYAEAFRVLALAVVELAAQVEEQSA
jgi:hypothetical protein